MEPIDVIAAIVVGIVAVALLLTLGAVVGGLIGYVITLSYNALFGMSVSPMLGALGGSIVATLSGGAAGASSQ